MITPYNPHKMHAFANLTAVTYVMNNKKINNALCVEFGFFT